MDLDAEDRYINYKLLHGHTRYTHRQQVDPGGLSSLEERLPGKDTLGSEFSRLAFEQSPIYIERDAIVTKGSNLLEHVKP